MHACIHTYIHTYVRTYIRTFSYGQFSKFYVCFCGLDPGYLKFETVRTHRATYLLSVVYAGAIGLPAGTAVVGIAATMVECLGRLGLAGMTPVPCAADAVKEALTLIDADPRPFHPGAHHMFTGMNTKTLAVEDLKAYVGQMGNFFPTSGKHPSLVRPKHIRELIDNSPHTVFTSVGKRFAKGIELEDEAITRIL